MNLIHWQLDTYCYNFKIRITKFALIHIALRFPRCITSWYVNAVCVFFTSWSYKCAKNWATKHSAWYCWKSSFPTLTCTTDSNALCLLNYMIKLGATWFNDDAKHIEISSQMHYTSYLEGTLSKSKCALCFLLHYMIQQKIHH